MPTSPINEVLHYLRSTWLPDGADLTDGQLLECFVSGREPAALEALVRRHGPMVWGVCHRILRNHHDAEDAFQATFLVLVRRAASIRWGGKVANWLYGVAQQTALKARATRAKRRLREAQGTDMPEPAAAEQDSWGDLQTVLDQELGRLPEKYRTVIVLCDLEGKTGKEAARQLRLAQGTVASRLARARRMLAKRLARQGLAVLGGTLAAVLSQKAAPAAVPGSVMNATIKAVTLVAEGRAAAAGLISARVAALTEGVMKAMLLTRLQIVAALVIVLGITALGVGHVLLQAQAAGRPKEPAANEKPAAPKAEAPERAPQPKDDMDRLQGTWRLVRSESDGLTLDGDRPEIKDTLLVIAKSSVTMTGKAIPNPALKTEPEDVKAVGTFTLDTKKNPKQIVIAWESTPWGTKEAYMERGIYALDGDTLKLCFYFPGSDTKRLVPPEFSARAGSKRNVGTWKRVSPSEKGGRKENASKEETERPTAKTAQQTGEVKTKPGVRPAERVKEDKARLQGTWQLISLEWDGLTAGEGRPELKETRLRIEQDTLTLSGTPLAVLAKSGAKNAVADFTLDPGQTPRVIVLTWKECPWNGKKDFVRKAIYAVDGDRLQLCLSREDNEKEAPREFSAKTGSGRLLWTFQRVPPPEKRGEEKDAPRGRRENE